MRQGKDPSVTALLIRRAGPRRQGPEPVTSTESELAHACRMTRILHTWEPRASLPLLRDRMKECREASDRWLASGPNASNFDRNLSSILATFASFRADLGDPAGLDDYAAWARTTTPTMLDNQVPDAFRPLWTHPDRPAIAEAARWLFTDPASPWVPLSTGAGPTRSDPFRNLFASPLVAVAAFRQGLLTALADRAEDGTVEYDGKQQLNFRTRDGGQMGTSTNNREMEGIPIGRPLAYRACDLVASKLAGLEGMPRCEVFWPEPRRDEAVQACVAHLRKYGDRLSAEPIAGLNLPPFGPSVHLAFPTLDRPATPADVASARAIFHLEGPGEARKVKLPGLPAKARWLTLRDTPIDRTYQDGITRREYDTDGLVWQAEQTGQGDQLQRWYGFVGHHIVAKAPASEVEFAGDHAWGNLEGGLDARAELVEPRPNGIKAGRPIQVLLRLRNRKGLPKPAPTEVIRADNEGKPTLRRGVTLALFRTAKPGPVTGMNAIYPNEPVAPQREAHFEPGDSARTLETLEAFEAARIDLAPWFGPLPPGQYRLQVQFDAGSGLGQGSASPAYFLVLGDE